MIIARLIIYTSHDQNVKIYTITRAYHVAVILLFTTAKCLCEVLTVFQHLLVLEDAAVEAKMVHINIYIAKNKILIYYNHNRL